MSEQLPIAAERVGPYWVAYLIDADEDERRFVRIGVTHRHARARVRRAIARTAARPGQ